MPVSVVHARKRPGNTTVIPASESSRVKRSRVSDACAHVGDSRVSNSRGGTYQRPSLKDVHNEAEMWRALRFSSAPRNGGQIRGSSRRVRRVRARRTRPCQGDEREY